ncbi:Chemokine (C-C motif) receptor 2 [Mactra antiquata]
MALDRNNSMFVQVLSGIFGEENGTLDDVFDDMVEVKATHEITVIYLTILFFIIGVIGILGNLLVIFAVICSKKMRKSMTNLLITNLAFADLLIMVFGIPEIFQFMMNKGWTFDDFMCRGNRYILVTSLYGSVLTLISLCVERYIAIIHPIKAHILCNRRRIVVVLGCIWPFAWLAGLPTLFFNIVKEGHPLHPENQLKYCMMEFPDNPKIFYLVFKLIESACFYFLPLSIQLTLYAFVSKHLFIGSDRLHRTYTVRDRNGTSMERYSEAIQARKGVVKMLMASVIVYFLSYSPNQILLVWNVVQPKTFHENWTFLVLTMIIAYVNSAANPILYSIFSQNFRECFRDILCRCCPKRPERRTLRAGSMPSTYNTYSTTSRYLRHTSLASAVTDV